MNFRRVTRRVPLGRIPPCFYMSGCKNAKDVTRSTHLTTITSNVGRPANERAAANILSPVGVRSLSTFVTDFFYIRIGVSPRRLGAATGALLNQSHFRYCAVSKGLILRLGQILHRLKTNVPTIVDTQCGIWLCDSARRPVLSRFSFVFFIGVCGCVRSGVYRGGCLPPSLILTLSSWRS